VTQHRVILADDHHVVAESLARSLGDEFEVVALAHDGEATLAALERHEADCLVLDLQMPKLHGLEVIPRSRQLRPATAIVVLTMHADRNLAGAALALGALGFVPKDAPLAELTRAIRVAIAGRRYLSPLLPNVTHKLGADADHPGVCRLTPRQREVLLLVGEGRSSAEIASALGLSPSSITFHRQNCMRALGLATEAALLQYAVLVRTSLHPGG
jgi:DNA-binding NarL/FixJ family response regulator